jgi:hypothetical protein
MLTAPVEPVKFPPYTPGLTNSNPELRRMPNRPKPKIVNTSTIAAAYRLSNASVELRLKRLGVEPLSEEVKGSKTFRLWDLDEAKERLDWYDSLSRKEKLEFGRKQREDELPQDMQALATEVREMKDAVLRILDTLEKKKGPDHHEE